MLVTTRLLLVNSGSRVVSSPRRLRQKRALDKPSPVLGKREVQPRRETARLGR
jgi:hypothetical protein